VSLRKVISFTSIDLLETVVLLSEKEDCRILGCQGYEPFALHMLLDNGIDEDDIYTGIDVPSIKYHHKNKNCVYYPDIYIKSTNTIIEVTPWLWITTKILRNFKPKPVTNFSFTFSIPMEQY